MSQSTSLRASCSIASEWEDPRRFPLHRGFMNDPLFIVRCEENGVMVRFAKSRQWMGFVGIFKQGVTMIQCIRSSSCTGYMLMKVRHDLPEVGFVKIPRDKGGSVRVFVDVSTEHIMEFGHSQASVSLWWNVNSSNNDWWKLPGQIEWAADNGEMF